MVHNRVEVRQKDPSVDISQAAPQKEKEPQMRLPFFVCWNVA